MTGYETGKTGSEVWVAKGTYTSSIAPVVTMKADVNIYGGFVGTESTREQRDWTINSTVIDGQKSYRCVDGYYNATLDGFIVKKGKSSFNGGMFWGTAEEDLENRLTMKSKISALLDLFTLSHGRLKFKKMILFK